MRTRWPRSSGVWVADLIRVREYEAIPRSRLGKLADRLQAFDERLARTRGETVFNWGLRRDVRAKNYVGVIQVPGLTIEVMPKIDDPADETERGSRAQSNLLHMLTVAQQVPARDRETSPLARRHHSMIDAFVGAFAERLLVELRRGVHHQYVHTEENRRYFRGRLLFAEHTRLNSVHQERCFSALDEFLPDTPLNRLLKATCRHLCFSVRAPWVHHCLSEALLELGDVGDAPLSSRLLATVRLDRTSERFSELVHFCQLVVDGMSPVPGAGEDPSFALLFPMDRVFEAFVGRLIQRNAARLGLAGSRISLQGGSRRRWLFLRDDDRGAYRLKPDVLIERPGACPVVLDTKWKRISTESSDADAGAVGVSPGDMYQLHAYLTRYECDEVILLCPRTDGARRGTFRLAGDPGRRVRVELLDVQRDLTARSAQDDLLRELAAVFSTDSGFDPE